MKTDKLFMLMRGREDGRLYYVLSEDVMNDDLFFVSGFRTIPATDGRATEVLSLQRNLLEPFKW